MHRFLWARVLPAVLLPACFYSVADLEHTSASSSGAGGCDPSSLMTSKTDCGRCGHDCRGGDCFDGVCQPAALATVLEFPTGIAVDDTHVYWAEESYPGKVRRVVKTGGEPEDVFSGVVAAPFGVALDEGHVYATIGGHAVAPIEPGRVLRTKKDLTGQLELAAQEEHPTGIAVHAGKVYWTAQDAVRWCASDGSGAPATLVADPGTLYAITVGPGGVYWANRTTCKVMRADLDGGSPTAVSSGQGSPRGMTLVGNLLYWTEDGYAPCVKIGRVMHFDAAGSPEVLASSPTSAPRDVAVVGGIVFYTDTETGYVASLPQQDPQPHGNTPHDLAVDADAIYWTEYDAGDVKVLVR